MSDEAGRLGGNAPARKRREMVRVKKDSRRPFLVQALSKVACPLFLALRLLIQHGWEIGASGFLVQP
jgi:hypothetical protein